MSDIYVPGVKSRFNTEKLIEDLMKVERVPRDRVEKNVERLKNEKTYWQDVNRRMTALKDSARLLFSFQNPFNDRIVNSQDSSVITGSATREALEQERSFTISRIAQADRFLSAPLDDSFRIEPGNYTFSVGKDEVNFNFRGGTLREFTESLNRRGKNIVQASIVTVQRGTRSLLVESLVTGEGNRLVFSGDAEKLALDSGMMEKMNDSRRPVELTENFVRAGAGSVQLIAVEKGELWAGAGGNASVLLRTSIPPEPGLLFTFEASTETFSEEMAAIPEPPPGPAIPETGSVTYGGITVENDDITVTLPQWIPPEPPKRVDDLAFITLGFTDGSSARLPAIKDSEEFKPYQYRLQDLAGDKSIASINIENRNTHRDINIRNILVYDPRQTGGLEPTNPVSVARDAEFTMDGIELKRASNNIDDILPGVTLTLKSASERPVTLGVEPDRETIKDSIISLAGNYNRLMAEMNVLTRTDERIVEDLTYLSAEERDSLRERLGVFAGDSTLSSFRGGLQRAASTPYPTSDMDLSLLAQIGIGTDVRSSGASTGYDPSRLRGYLEIDEKVLDNALASRLAAVQQLFGLDTDGDLLVDSGLAYTLDKLTQPYVETGGIITLKTGTIDSRINQDTRRIDTMERQLAAKEMSLKNQYAQMEGAYSRMEQLSTSLDSFSQQTSGNNNRR
ncbi:MAG: flagellar filament capping protein FliD [Spirochaetaceae bacterium]|jgi:flagellar hook-associated protein 2|nr:flagellar filament capping protein FliD [Spirochaetaceae bacterium]